MAYFLGACSLALALVVLGAACLDADHCGADEVCPCNDGTEQPAGCTVPAATCDEACSGHGGVDSNAFNPPDGGDGG